MAFDHTKAPFPYFGGKSRAAPAVWEALGDVGHYVEPFAGSLAVLLNRPHEINRAYFSETVNDLDGLLVNAWRSIQLSPHATAEACSGPVMEADIAARHIAVIQWRDRCDLQRLMADPKWHDPVMAGYWLYGICAWIGSGWASGDGPWHVEDGRFVKQARGKRRPWLWEMENGEGREPGVNSKLPHFGDGGRGVHSAGLREPGVRSQLPHFGTGGRGVHSAGLREPGVRSQLPHFGTNGNGVHSAGLREPGVRSQLPHFGTGGRGVHSPQLREPGETLSSLAMPKLIQWFEALSARLRHVRVVNGDWKRVCTKSVSKTLSCDAQNPAGVFFDPPYLAEVRAMGLYANDSGDIAHEVRGMAREIAARPNHRVVIAGFDTEHAALESEGWRCVEWFTDGFITGGMGNSNADGHSQKRERLWLSPGCLGAVEERQTSLFGGQS